MSNIRRSQLLAGALSVGLTTFTRRAEAQSLAPVRIGTVPVDTFAGAYFAQDMGFFQKAGLSADLQTFQNGSAISTAVVGGALDIGAATPITLANAVVRGVPFVMIAPGGVTTAKAPGALLIVGKNSPIRVAGDLEGKTVAVTGIRALADLTVDAWLTQNGVSATKVSRVEMPVSSMMSAIERGAVAAALINEPTMSAVLKTNEFRSIGNLYLAISPVLLTTAWYTTTTFAQQNPDVVKRFQSAILAAQRWANSHHDESAVILAKYAKMDAEAVRTTVRCPFPDQIRIADIQPEFDAAFKFGILPKAVNASDFLSH